jgi:hypothetical protein
MVYVAGVRWTSFIAASVACLPLATLASDNLRVQISVADNILKGGIDGRVVLMFAPNGTDPLDDTDVTSTPNKMFGKNVLGFGARDKVVLSGGGPNNTAAGVSGWPLVSMGKYFLKIVFPPLTTQWEMKLPVQEDLYPSCISAYFEDLLDRAMIGQY